MENAIVSQMFSYSALSFIRVSNCCLFSDINISQGSAVMHLGCGGIFSCHFTADLLLSLTVKEFWKSHQMQCVAFHAAGVFHHFRNNMPQYSATCRTAKIWQSYRHEFGGLLFWNTV